MYIYVEIASEFGLKTDILHIGSQLYSGANPKQLYHCRKQNLDNMFTDCCPPSSNNVLQS